MIKVICRDLEYIIKLIKKKKEFCVICILDYNPIKGDESSFEMTPDLSDGKEAALLKKKGDSFEIRSRANIYFYAPEINNYGIEQFRAFCVKRSIVFIEFIE